MKNVLLERLEEGKFGIWFTQIENILGANEVHELIEKEYEDKLSKEEFTGQSKAKFYVLSALSIQDKEFVNECKTVKEIIDRLKVKYMKPEDMYHLNEEFHSLKWGMEAAEVFIAKMNDIKTRMKKLDKDLKDDNFFYKLIDQVPHFLSITKQQILYERYRKLNTITYENACDTLIQAYNTYQLQKKMKQENGERQNNDQRNGRSNNSAFFTSVKRCRDCGSIEHLAKNCHKLNDGYNNNSYNQNRRNGYNNGRRGGYNSRNRHHVIQDQGQSTNGNANEQHTPNENQTATTAATPQNKNDQNQNNSRNRPQSNTYNQSQNQNRGGQYRNNNVPGTRPVDQNDYKQLNERFENMGFCVFEESAQRRDEDICLDNCASSHIVNSMDKFKDYQPFEIKEKLISIGNGYAVGKGLVPVTAIIRGQAINYNLKDVLYVPNSPVNLFSQIAAEQSGMRFNTTESDSHLYTSGYYEGEKDCGCKKIEIEKRLLQGEYGI